MQLLGKDVIVLSFSGSKDGKDPVLLHQTQEGFQFGTGRERQIVTDLAQVPVEIFGPVAHRAVKAWLEENGPAKAEEAVMQREVAEQASEAPGTLDALADRLGPEIKSQLFQLLKGAVKGQPLPKSPIPLPAVTESVDGLTEEERAKLPDPALVANPVWKKVDGGWILDKGHGHGEFFTEESKQAYDADLTRELALVGAGSGKSHASESAGTFGKQIERGRKVTRKA